MPPKDGAAKARPKGKSADNARGDDDDGDNGAAAAAARACAEESRRLVDVAVTRGVRRLVALVRAFRATELMTRDLVGPASRQLLSRAKAVAPRELPLSDGARLRRQPAQRGALTPAGLCPTRRSAARCRARGARRGEDGQSAEEPVRVAPGLALPTRPGLAPRCANSILLSLTRQTPPSSYLFVLPGQLAPGSSAGTLVRHTECSATRCLTLLP